MHPAPHTVDIFDASYCIELEVVALFVGERGTKAFVGNAEERATVAREDFPFVQLQAKPAERAPIERGRAVLETILVERRAQEAGDESAFGNAAAYTRLHAVRPCEFKEGFVV